MDIELEDFIIGEKFISLADNQKIFYCHTHDVNSFFLNCNKDKEFTLISHNSDGCVTDNPRKKNFTLVEHHADLRLIPENCIKWFAQNVEVENEIVEPIPIGLENSYCFPFEKKNEKISNISNKEKKIKNLIYLNINTYDGQLLERVNIYRILDNKNYVTIERGRNGLNFDSYLENLHNHKFMICPEGNGIDVHQPWEALYTGTIPIQKKNNNNKNWRELPVCWLDDWAQLEDENFLNDEYNRITTSQKNLEKATFTYWKNKISKYK